MADVYLSQRDIDYISRVVATEVPGYLAETNPAEYSRMVGAVVDTITNRMASENFPSTVEGVVNQPAQFSAINGPIDGAYGSVQNAPKASQALQNMVAGHIADISQGVQQSEIGGSLNYANPFHSDQSNLNSWVNPMIEAGALQLGIGQNVHYHGVIPGDEPVGPYGLTAEGIPATADIPTPYSPDEGLLSGWDALASAAPVEAMPAGPGWGLNRDVAPALTPTTETWSAMANAAPIQTPTQGLLAADPTLNSFSDLAAAGPFGGQYAAPQDRFGPNPNPNGITQADIDRSLFGPGTMGFDPAFAESLMSPSNPVVPSAVTSTSFTPGNVVSQPAEVANFDTSRLGGLLGPSVGVMDASRLATDEKTSRIGSNVMADMGRMLPSVDPMTNTQSFMDQPAATGILSGEHQMVQAQAEQALQNALQASQTAAASYNVPATGVLGTNAPLSAQASINSIVSPSSIAAPAQINATATPEQMAAGYSQMAASAAPAGLLGLSGNNLNTIDLSNNIVATPSYTPTNQLEAQVAEAPALDNVTVPDQPSISPTVEGPATTNALDQQQQQTAQTQQARTINSPAQVNPSLSFGQRLGAMVNPGTAIGGLLGGLALGPVGGFVGGLLGNSVYSGGLLGSNSFVSPTNQIGGGVSNIASIYSGQQSPGTYAVASNGATITAQPGGYTSYENKFGVREVVGPDGKIAADWGGLFSGDDNDEGSEQGGGGGSRGGGLLGGWL